MHPTQHREIRKPGVSSRGGVVASQSRTAATVGADILAAGGTAVDAAVATALALTALGPWNSGLGGIGFMVVHRAGADHAEAVDFGPMAPRGLNPAAFPLTGGTRTGLFTWPQVEGDRNIHGPLAFAVPSAVRGYVAAIERFGRMSWRERAAPAAALAREGLPVDWFTTVKVAAAAAELRLYDESRRVWLPEPGIARHRRPQPRHFRRHVPVVRRSRCSGLTNAAASPHRRGARYLLGRQKLHARENEGVYWPRTTLRRRHAWLRPTGGSTCLTLT